MRASTFVFLGILAAFVVRHGGPCAPVHFACGRSGETATAASEPASPGVREWQGELDRLERRGRDLERSLQAVSQSARTLRELAERHGDAAVRAELAEIEAGRERLKQLRDRNEVARVAASARLQLARAGLAEEPCPSAAGERASPVDALSAGSAAQRVTVRAR